MPQKLSTPTYHARARRARTKTLCRARTCYAYVRLPRTLKPPRTDITHHNDITISMRCVCVCGAGEVVAGRVVVVVGRDERAYAAQRQGAGTAVSREERFETERHFNILQIDAAHGMPRRHAIHVGLFVLFIICRCQSAASPGLPRRRCRRRRLYSVFPSIRCARLPPRLMFMPPSACRAFMRPRHAARQPPRWLTPRRWFHAVCCPPSAPPDVAATPHCFARCQTCLMSIAAYTCHAAVVFACAELNRLGWGQRPDIKPSPRSRHTFNWQVKKFFNVQLERERVGNV